MINWILILAIAWFAYYMYKKYNGKPVKYIIGSALIFIGAIFIEPSPDFFSFGLYAATHGLQYSSFNAGNISAILWDYELWSVPIGILSVLGGMYLLGWSWERLWKKLNLEKYWIAVLLAVLVVILIAWIDIKGMIYWTSFSSMENYTNGLQGAAFWNFFKSIVFAMFLILPLSYYFLFRKDISEALSIFTTEMILWMTGFSDVMFFVLQKLPLPDRLPWLDFHPIIAPISHLFGHASVTNIGLLTSVLVGFIIVFVSNKILKEKF